MKDKDRFSIPPRLLVNILQYLLPVVALGALFYFFPQVSNLATMLFLSLLLSYLFFPVVDRLERRGLERGLATIVVFIGIGGIFTWLTWITVPEVAAQISELQHQAQGQDFQAIINRWVNKVEAWLPMIDVGYFNNPADVWLNRIMEQFATLQDIASGVLQFMGDFLLYLTLMPLFAFFIIRDRRELRRYVIQSFPNQYFEMVFNMYYKIDQKLGSYIRGLVIEALVMAVFSLLGFLLTDVPFAVLNAIFLGVTNVVPYFGPIVGAIPAVGLKLVEAQDPYAMVGVLIVVAVVQVLDNIIVKPYVFSRSMDLHPVIVMLVVIGGGQLYGVAGMIFSIPVVSMIFVIVSEFNWAVRNFRFET